MTLSDSVRELLHGAGRQWPLLTMHSLRLLFPGEKPAALRSGIRALLRCGMLERIGRGVYVNHGAPNPGHGATGRAVRQLRPNALNYLSHEAALSQHGVISQVPFCHTVATTAASGGRHDTPWGVIEFHRTSRTGADIRDNTEYSASLGLRVASPAMAHEDLRRVRPAALQLVDEDELARAIAEWEASGARHAA